MLFATMRRTCLFAVLLFSIPAFGENEEPFLATLSIERADPSQTDPLDGDVKLSIEVSDPKRVASMLEAIDGVEVISIGDIAVELIVSAQPTSSSPLDERFLESSFIVDFAEPSVQAMQQEFREQFDAPPSADDLQTFVHNHIDNKTYMRSFDFASKVASTGEGDCTEHAVLLAALARAEGIPARVVVGTLILDGDAGLSAYGHAWTEIYDDAAWKIVDATLPPDEKRKGKLRYLPISVFENEGPGYTFGMIEIVNSMPAKITGVANLRVF